MIGPSFKMCTHRKIIMRNITHINLSLRTMCTWNLIHKSNMHHMHMCAGKHKQRQFSLVTHLTSIKNGNHSLIALIPFGRHYSTSKVTEGSANLPSISADLFFPEFPTIQGAEAFISGLHNTTGFPWWSTIIMSAFLLRILLPLPLSIYSMHNSIRLQRLQPEIKGIADRLKKEVSMAVYQFGWTQKKAKTEYIKNLKRHLRNLYIRDNCHPMKDTASFWIRIPIWVSASYALRNMSVRAGNPHLDNHETCQSMSTEGLAWFVDLTLVDSTFILPVMMGAVTLLNVEIGRRSISEMTTYRRYLTYGLRGLSFVIIPISAYLPSGLVLYWISSGFFSVIQTVLVDRSKTFQNLIGIKPPSETSQQPPKKSKSDSES